MTIHLMLLCLFSHLLDLSREQVSGFAERVKDIAEESGFTPKLNQSADVYSTFTLKQNWTQTELMYRRLHGKLKPSQKEICFNKTH